MKYVLRLGACRCWEPNILCFAGDTRKDCQGMWINSCWCRPLTVFPLIWHARGIYQKETTSSKHFTNLNGFDTTYLMFYSIKKPKFNWWINLAENMLILMHFSDEYIETFLVQKYFKWNWMISKDRFINLDNVVICSDG